MTDGMAYIAKDSILFNKEKRKWIVFHLLSPDSLTPMRLRTYKFVANKKVKGETPYLHCLME
ncbi:MAG: hypothetical protein ACJAT7_002130 [Psychromonas sp.]|jgi:hypothetical protein